MAPSGGEKDWRLTKARTALENWGRHFDWCASRYAVPQPCSCGLATALAEADAATDLAEAAGTLTEIAMRLPDHAREEDRQTIIGIAIDMSPILRSADTLRINWLEQNPALFERERLFVTEYLSLRAAIDAAMSKEAPHGA